MILTFNKTNLVKEISTATFGENLKTERIEKHGRWKVGIVWNWGDEDRIHGEMQYLEGGWAYTGFCCAVHPAGVSLQFIKSSDIKVWKWWWRGLSHTSRHGWDNGHSRNGQRGVAVLERANHSWLVKEEDWQSSVSCIYVCVVSGIVSAWRGGKRTSGRELASQQWQSNPRGQWREWDHTHAQAWHAIRKLSLTLHALYASLYIYECMFYLVSTYSNKHARLLKCVCVDQQKSLSLF